MALTLAQTSVTLNTTVSSFWNISDETNHSDRDALLHQLEDEQFQQVLSKLGQDEIAVIRTILITKNNASKRDILNSYPSDAKKPVEETITFLMDRYLVYERKKLSSLSQRDYLYFLFEEIYNKLSEVVVTKVQDVQPYPKTTYGQLRIPHDNAEEASWLHKTQGIIPYIFQDRVSQTRSIPLQYYMGRKVIPFYQIPLKYVKSIQLPKEGYSQRYLSFFISLVHFAEGFSHQVIAFTKRRTLHKDDYELIASFFNGNMAEAKAFFKLALQKKLLVEKHQMIIPTPAFRQLLTRPLLSQLAFFLETIPGADILLHHIRSFRHQPFYPADLDKQRISTAWQEELNELEATIEMSCEKQVEQLYQWGLLARLEYEGEQIYQTTSLFWLYIHQKPIENIKEIVPDSFMLGEDYTITVDPKLAVPYQLYLLEIFGKSVTKDVMYTYRITKESLQNVVHLGLNAQPFLDMLKRGGRLPEAFFYNIQEWISKYKQIKLKSILVIQGDEETTEEVWSLLHTKLSGVERIGKKTIKIEDEIPKLYQLLSRQYYIEEEDSGL
jgi:hypothetical protein